MKKFLYNPFESYSEKKLVLIGSAGNLVLIGLSYMLNTKFIGNLKTIAQHNIEFYQVIIQHLIILIATTAMLLLIGKYLNSKTRFIDILATTLVSRIAFCLIPIVNINQKMFTISQQILSIFKTNKPEISIGNDLPYFIMSIIIILFSIVWFLILLYNGFKTATNAKDVKTLFLFIATILLIEILSQLLIFKLM